jgi:ABC-2 type transport system permease protein
MSPNETIESAKPDQQRRDSNHTGLLRSELRILFRRLRTLAILTCLAGVPVLLAVAVKMFSAPSGPNEGPPFLYQVASNGLFVALTGLVVTLPLFLPLAVGVVAGDSLAGEANQGTLRYLLVVPTGRIRLLVVKLASVLIFCLVAAFTVALAGMAIGAVLFPLGPVTLLSGDTIGASEAFGRAPLAAQSLLVGVRRSAEGADLPAIDRPRAGAATGLRGRVRPAGLGQVQHPRHPVLTVLSPQKVTSGPFRHIVQQS